MASDPEPKLNVFDLAGMLTVPHALIISGNFDNGFFSVLGMYLDDLVRQYLQVLNLQTRMRSDAI